MAGRVGVAAQPIRAGGRKGVTPDEAIRQYAVRTLW